MVNVNIGPGSFKGTKDALNNDGDTFKLAEGTTKLQPKVSPVATTTGSDVIPAHTGYGFWFRYLTHYPARLWSGKNAPWYFLARLTFNVQVTDATFGDRILAVW